MPEPLVPSDEELDQLLGTDTHRRRLASKLKTVHDVKLPHLKHWNYDGCEHHPDGPVIGCEYRKCGGPLYRTQRQGIAWLHLVKKGLLGDETGTGKTNQILGLCCLLKQQGELTGRAVIVCQTPAAPQWLAEAQRWAPGLNSIASVSGMSAREREEQIIHTNWDVLIIGYHMMLRDIDLLCRLEPTLVVSDDVDPLRDAENATAYAFRRLADQAERCVVINATPLQVRLQELHATTTPVGGFQIFGSLKAFEIRYVRRTLVTEVDSRTGRKTKRTIVDGYKNMEEFRRKLEPFYIRRTDADMDEGTMPQVMPPTNHWLDPSPLQRVKYEELQRGVVRLIKEEGEKVKRVQALAKVTYGAMLCSSLTTLGEPDSMDASAKLDWLMDRLTGEWYDRKVICYIRFKDTIKTLYQRLEKENIDLALIVGGKQTRNKALRQQQIDRFWNDPNCRVLAGTSALERSLNLQVSNIVVCFDSLLNPARMHQIVGRAKRAGSKFKHVYVHNLFLRDTQEERYLGVLQRRQALIDFVWGEENDLYEQLTPLELLQLIRP